MTAVVLSAGRAERLGGRCKALVEVGGRRMIDWQADMLGEPPIVVARPEHVAHVEQAGYQAVPCPPTGPAEALKAALPHLPHVPVTVLFADTWFSDPTPAGSSWVGVAEARGGREWDVVDRNGWSARQWLPPSQIRTVAIGAYRFGSLDVLEHALLHAPPGPFAWVCNAYRNVAVFAPLRFAGWQDVGDPAALAAWRPPT